MNYRQILHRAGVKLWGHIKDLPRKKKKQAKKKLVNTVFLLETYNPLSIDQAIGRAERKSQNRCLTFITV